MSKAKYQQLFRFLKEFYQLRETTVRDITTSNKYLYHLWLDDFSDLPGARYRLLKHDMENDESLVLTLKRPKRPAEPEKPECQSAWRPWLKGSLFDLDFPAELHDAIDKDGEVLILDSFPDLKTELITYLKHLSNWRESQVEYKELFAIYEEEKKVYDQLFEAATKLGNFNERYEFLLGTGLFCWQSRNIQRPIVTIPLEIEITDTGVIRISLSAATKLFQVENDFLATLDGFSIAPAIQVLEQKLTTDQLNFWEIFDNLQINGFQVFVNMLGTEVDYSLAANPPTQLPIEPTIYYSPVLIFRERSVRSFTVLFESILQHLDEQGDDFQINLLDRIVYDLNQLPTNRNLQNHSWQVTEEDILLPKESNHEQLEIARRISQRDVVLVQGPPGTGKSHTIANIITYLLSRGKKILVTAQTDQALKALRQHLPELFLDLVIYFLQGTERTDNDLGKSVRKLQDAINTYNPDEIQRSIERNRSELQRLREERALLLNDVKTLQQADKRLEELNGHYRDATLLDLTDQVKQDENSYSWMKDEIIDPAIALEQLENLVSWYGLWKEIKVNEFYPDKQIIPDMSQLPYPTEVKELKEKQDQFTVHYEASTLLPKAAIPIGDFKKMVEQFIELDAKLHPHQTWQREVQTAIDTGHFQVWENLQKRTKSLLSEVDSGKMEQIIRNYNFTIPANITPQQLRSDTLTVFNYVNTGKKLTGMIAGLSIPQHVKSCRHIYQECRINNQLCTQVQELRILLDYATIQLGLTDMDRLWENHAVSTVDLRRKYEGYEMLSVQLHDQLKNYPEYIDLRRKLSEVLQYPISFFEHPQAHFNLRMAIDAYTLHDAIDKLKRKVRHGIEYLQSFPQSDSQLLEMLSSLQTLDWNKYEQQYVAYLSLSKLVIKYRNMIAAQERLSSFFQNTILHLREDAQSVILEANDFENAIYWSNAKYQLKRRFSESIDEKYKQLKRNDEDFRGVTLTFLKENATKKFIENLSNTDELQQQLTRWTQAIRHAGGQGKQAFQYRRIAQQILQQISHDIPCWIMPMYRLVDTLGPRPETFDVVIVDEASQLGPEALFLKYITKKIIVVGDDQQTAPENVGINIDQINYLIRTHLQGIPYQQFFNTKHSFFEHVDAIAGRRIALREHFRCMPEIIEFSNQLCYRPNGIELVPLKQYSRDRLPPLEKYFVQNGTYDNEKNIPEARAIVETIKFLLKEKSYEGKSFGVIVLQGTSQHAEIDRRLRDELSPQDFLDRKIIVGTPPDFQGDERDIIFLSLVTAQDHQRRALTTDNFRRRYNVAMSRARDQVWLFHSVQEQDLNPNDLRFQLLHYFNTLKIADTPNKPQIPDPRDPSQKPPRPFDSWFEVDIYQEIDRRGYVVEPQYKVGPYRIDLVVHLPNGKKIAVECDGDIYHDGQDLQKDMERQLILERAKWEFFRIRWSHYKYSSEESLEKLWVLLEKRSEHHQKDNDGVKPAYLSVKQPSIDTDIDFAEEINIDEVQLHSTHEPPTESKIDIPTQSNECESDIVDILVFTNHARVYRYARVTKIEAKNLDVIDHVEVGEKEIYRITTSDYAGFMIFAYSNGKVDRVRLDLYRASRTVLQNAYHSQQELLYIKHFLQEADLVGITTEKKVIVFSTDVVSEHSSRGNQGNQLFRTGSEVKKYALLSDVYFSNPEYYRRTYTNSKGYYLKEKEGDRFNM